MRGRLFAARRVLVGIACLVAVATVAAPGILADVREDSGASPPTASAGSAAPPAKAPVTRRTTAGIGIFRYGERFTNSPLFRQYAYVVVDRYHIRAAAKLPGTALVYTSGANIGPVNTGVSKPRAGEQGWILRDSNGSIVESDDYDGLVLGDVGNPSYQREWLANVIALLRSTHGDGVFIDDVMADLRSWTKGRIYPAKYPDQTSWQAAMASFVKAVGPPLKARGYYVLANADGYLSDTPSANDGTTTVAWWRQLAPYVSGLLNEYWEQNPIDFAQLRSVGEDWYQQWVGWQRLVAVAQSFGVDFFGLSYGTPADLRTMRFGRGSFLLDWNGKGGAFAYDTRESDDPTNAAWTFDVGRPVRSKFELAPGVWRRRYQHAIVVVNATTTPVTLVVAGARRTIDPTDAIIAPA